VNTPSLNALARDIGEVLSARGMTLALAESCTGGLLGHTVTGIAGASRYFLGGVTCYSNASKVTLLHVRAETLREFGAVSEQCAEEMVAGIMRLFVADVAVAVTGIAGPDGGCDEKPVGTVFVAIGTAERREVHKYCFKGERASIREQATTAALACLYNLLQ